MDNYLNFILVNQFLIVEDARKENFRDDASRINIFKSMK